MNIIQELTILIINNNTTNQRSIKKILTHESINIRITTDEQKTIKILREQPITIIVTNYQIPKITKLDLLKSIHTISPKTKIILITTYKSIKITIATMKQGTYNFIVKPFKQHNLLQPIKHTLKKRTLIKKNHHLKKELNQNARNHEIIRSSIDIQKTLKLINQITPSSATILITNKNKTNKKLIARTIHTHSNQSDHTFITINCTAIPNTILKSKLFNYKHGTFTKTNQQQTDQFKRTHKKTLFLNKIKKITLHTQIKLLHILQKKKIEHLNNNQTITMNYHIITTTNQNLKKKIKTNRFHKDLYYHLNMISIPLPPLHEQKNNVPLLTHHFLNIYNQKNQKHIKKIEQNTINRLIN